MTANVRPEGRSAATALNVGEARRSLTRSLGSQPRSVSFSTCRTRPTPYKRRKGIEREGNAFYTAL